MAHTSEYHSIIADRDARVVREQAVPAGKLKRELIYLADREGHAIGVSTPTGFRTGFLELPRSMFDDLMASSFLQQEGNESDGKIVYKLTPDGIGRGLTLDYDEQAHIAMYRDPDEDGLMRGYVHADGISLAEAVRRVVAMPADQRSKVASIGTNARMYDPTWIEPISRRGNFPSV